MVWRLVTDTKNASIGGGNVRSTVSTRAEEPDDVPALAAATIVWAGGDSASVTFAHHVVPVTVAAIGAPLSIVNETEAPVRLTAPHSGNVSDEPLTVPSLRLTRPSAAGGENETVRSS